MVLWKKRLSPMVMRWSRVLHICMACKMIDSSMQELPPLLGSRGTDWLCVTGCSDAVE